MGGPATLLAAFCVQKWRALKRLGVVHTRERRKQSRVPRSIWLATRSAFSQVTRCPVGMAPTEVSFVFRFQGDGCSGRHVWRVCTILRCDLPIISKTCNCLRSWQGALRTLEINVMAGRKKKQKWPWQVRTAEKMPGTRFLSDSALFSRRCPGRGRGQLKGRRSAQGVGSHPTFPGDDGRAQVTREPVCRRAAKWLRFCPCWSELNITSVCRYL